jgi:hypothetical protein
MFLMFMGTDTLYIGSYLQILEAFNIKNQKSTHYKQPFRQESNDLATTSGHDNQIHISNNHLLQSNYFSRINSKIKD